MSCKKGVLLDALLSGSAVRDAAQLAGMSERQAYRVLKEPGFVSQLRQAQSEHLAALGLRLAVLGDAALSALISAMDDPNQPGADVRRLAAVNVLELGAKFHELVDIEQRLQAVEDRLGAR